VNRTNELNFSEIVTSRSQHKIHFFNDTRKPTNPASHQTSQQQHITRIPTTVTNTIAMASPDIFIPGQMQTFGTLPQEIRDKIYGHALVAETTYIVASPLPKVPALAALLLFNKQLNEEAIYSPPAIPSTSPISRRVSLTLQTCLD
jgi:hypothetical protein